MTTPVTYPNPCQPGTGTAIPGSSNSAAGSCDSSVGTGGSCGTYASCG